MAQSGTVMQEAAGISALLKAQAKGAPQAVEASHEEALCSIAASRAAAANAQVRCGQCEACICAQGSPTPRRCLLNRAAAAAAAGHSGAQVVDTTRFCYYVPTHQATKSKSWQHHTQLNGRWTYAIDINCPCRAQ